jgi:hypothetical protein
MSWKCESLEQKHPEVGQEVARNPVIRVWSRIRMTFLEFARWGLRRPPKVGESQMYSASYLVDPHTNADIICPEDVLPLVWPR